MADTKGSQLGNEITDKSDFNGLTDALYFILDPDGTPASYQGAIQYLKDLIAETDVLENDQTGTSYTLVASDAGKEIRMANASAITLTVPPNSSVAFDTGTVIFLIQTGAGQVTVSEGAGVTINSADDNLSLRGQWSAAYLKKTATDTWELVGDLA